MRRVGRACPAVIVVVAGVALAACGAPPPALVPAAPAPSVAAVPGPGPTPEPAPAQEIVIGVDRLDGGFNPHTLADLTPLSTAVASLLLPSAFRQAPDGHWSIDHTLLTSAEVTSTAPFTVTYRIRHNAQWSDTAPIAAEDFGYLAEQMRTQPGVVDSAGYQLIDQVISRDGGKTAEVVFSRPYPAWRTLFRHLLPAHLLKDAPGGWSEGLARGLVVSGGPFTVVSVDRARGELVLARNDRYWDTPATADRIVLRAGSDAALVAALRNGGAQAALFGQPNAITESLLREAGLTATMVPQPIMASVLLRPGGAVLRDERVRTAVAAALDRPSLIATGVGSGPSAQLVADSQLRAPAAAGYRPAAPDGGPPVEPDPELVDELLTAAGYVRGAAGWERGGTPLRLVVAAPADREPYGVLAARVADQLRSAGIAVELRSVDPYELFDTLPQGPEQPSRLGLRQRPVEGSTAGIDIVVLPQPTTGHPGTALASWHGCPLVVPARLTPAPPNPAGFCDLSLQPVIERALVDNVDGNTVDGNTRPVAPPVTATTATTDATGATGATGLADPALDLHAALDEALWRRVVTVPLYQQASLLVVTDELDGLGPGSPLEGPFDGAQSWRLDHAAS